MGQRIAASSERGLTTTVSDIEHIESSAGAAGRTKRAARLQLATKAAPPATWK
jgi:hypothetical protein